MSQDLDTTFCTWSNRHQGRDAEGRPYAPDPAHLAGTHANVEDSLFRDGGPPHCDLEMPALIIVRHLRDVGASRSLFFGEQSQALLDCLLYGRAVYEAAGAMVRHFNLQTLLEPVPDGLRTRLFGQPIAVPDKQRERYRILLRGQWFRIRSQEVERVAIAISPQYSLDLGDFAHRAAEFLRERLTTARLRKLDFLDTAHAGSEEFSRWQDILVAETKVMADKRKMQFNGN